MDGIKKTNYDNCEIIIVENNSCKDTFSFYRRIAPGEEIVHGVQTFQGKLSHNIDIKVVVWENEFNYSKLNNFGVQFATGKYYIFLNNDGEIYTEKRALDRIDMYNKNTWLNNQSVGDKIMVFGREYPICEDGHIHVPTEDFWTSGRCNYGKAI